jgi:xylan 1,4-beta-xylosidase
VDDEVLIEVEASQALPLRRIWRYVGYDEPNYTYTDRGRELLAKLGAMADGPYFIRCHFLLCSGDGTGRPKWGSTDVYTEDAQGDPVYSWRIIDRILDAYLEAGCIPFVELGFMPEALSTAPPGAPYDDPRHGGWRYPPRDYHRWRGLVEALAAHCLQRYGLRQVSRWYWELWNEPDIFYWQGSAAEYCRLYDFTEAGLHAAIPQAKLGGPAVTSPGRGEAGAFLHAFLAHCVEGENAVSGERGTRLDLVTFHTKGGGYQADPQAAKRTPTVFTLLGHVERGLAIVAQHPALEGLEVVLSECDPDGWAAGTQYDNPNLNYRNTAYYASYVACAACKLLDLGAEGPNRVDGMLTWAFQFEGREVFAGLRTLSTNGIDKPVLNVFRLLARLGARRLSLACSGARDPLAEGRGDGAADPFDVSAIAAQDQSGGVQLFLVAHHDDWDLDRRTAVRVRLCGLEHGAMYAVTRSAIDRRAANAYTAWVEMGAPQTPSPGQVCVLQEASRLRREDRPDVVADDVGNGELTIALDGHAVCLLEMVPQP